MIMHYIHIFFIYIYILEEPICCLTNLDFQIHKVSIRWADASNNLPRPGSFPRGDPVLTPRQKQKSSMNGEGASRQGESKRRRLVFVVGEECGNAPALCQTALKGVKAHSASVGKRGADRAHTHTLHIPA